MSSIMAQTSKKLDLETCSNGRKRLEQLENAMEDSIYGERSKESSHFKLFWMLWLSLHATLHFSSLQMFQKSTRINFGILFTTLTLSTYSRWTKGRDSNSIRKSSEISSRSALECINLIELLLLSLTEVYLERQLVWTSFVSPVAQTPLGYVPLKDMWDNVENYLGDFISRMTQSYKKQEKIQGDHTIAVVAHVSLAGTAPNAPPTLKDPKF
ncbi:hypothetical protein Tco_0866020 [Tanacetum coccineum]